MFAHKREIPFQNSGSVRIFDIIDEDERIRCFRNDLVIESWKIVRQYIFMTSFYSKVK